VADGVSHGHDGEAEGERNAGEANAEVDGRRRIGQEQRGEDGRAAASEDEPEGSEGFGESAVHEFHRVISCGRVPAIEHREPAGCERAQACWPFLGTQPGIYLSLTAAARR